MTDDDRNEFPPAIVSEEDFERALRRILVNADSNGVDVRGGWPIRTNSDVAGDWDLEIVELDEGQ
jgi:hypothetical protein